TEDFGAEARDIEARSAGGDHLDGAAGQAERERPDGRLAGPVEHVVHAGGDDILLELVLDKRGHLKRILSRSLPSGSPGDSKRSASQETALSKCEKEMFFLTSSFEAQGFDGADAGGGGRRG